MPVAIYDCHGSDVRRRQVPLAIVDVSIQGAHDGHLCVSDKTRIQARRQ